MKCLKKITRVGSLITLAFIVLLSSTTLRVVAFEQEINGLTIALDTLTPADTPQVIIDFMREYNYNHLRIYVGWCSSFYTGDPNNPMDLDTQDFLDELIRLCAENNFMVVASVSCQVSPLAEQHPEDRQTGEKGGLPYLKNYMDPIGDTFKTFTKNLVRTLVNLMEPHLLPQISVDEICYVTSKGKPAFYSDSMKAKYYADTGEQVPSFRQTWGPWTEEQQRFLEYAKNAIREFYQIMEAAAYETNPRTLFGALVDTYWQYPQFSYDTQPWDYYATLNEICYEWFYAIQNGNWQGLVDGLRRIKNLNPNSHHYFIYGTSTMTTIENMRYAVELAMAEDYDGVFLYEYAKSKNNPFDVSDLVITNPPPYWTLNITSTEGGTTSPSGNLNVSEGRTISITANADPGWKLSYWLFEGENIGEANPIIIPAQTVNTSHTLIAVFTEAPYTYIMHIGDIDMTRFGQKNVRCRAGVTIVDSAGNPVAGAAVNGSWSGVTSKTESKVTGEDGKAWFSTDRLRGISGTVIFTVDDVTKADYLYDPQANNETSDSIEI